MSDTVWLDETLYPDWGQRFRVRSQLAHVRTPFQDIVVADTFAYGRMMVLDGCIQITERDEFVYQEMLGHVPLLEHGGARRVLIIGAGDGGVLRRVLLHRNVERAVMVEIDGEVVRLAREFLPGIGGDAWTDPRAEIIVGDGIEYAASAPPGGFDVIIVDSTDPIGVGEVLFADAFYADCARVLAPGGLLVNQCGVPMMQPEELTQTSARRRRFFPFVSAYVAAVPTYVGGLMTLGVASKDACVGNSSVETIRERAKAQGMLGTSEYWTPEIHVGSFNLPPYIARLLAETPAAESAAVRRGT